jgi:hypothetical protein
MSVSDESLQKFCAPTENHALLEFFVRGRGLLRN